jgi:hypothetical protein
MYEYDNPKNPKTSAKPGVFETDYLASSADFKVAPTSQLCTCEKDKLGQSAPPFNIANLAS